MTRDTSDMAALTTTEKAIESAYERLRRHIRLDRTARETGERTATGSAASRISGAGWQPRAVSTLYARMHASLPDARETAIAQDQPALTYEGPLFL